MLRPPSINLSRLGAMVGEGARVTHLRPHTHAGASVCVGAHAPRARVTQHSAHLQEKSDVVASSGEMDEPSRPALHLDGIASCAALERVSMAFASRAPIHMGAGGRKHALSDHQMVVFPLESFATGRLCPFEALAEVSAALIERREPEAAAAMLVGLAIRRYLSGECADLASSLGIDIGRGGRHKTPAARKSARRRRKLVREALDLIGTGSRTRRADQLSAALKDSGTHLHIAQLDEVLEALRLECEHGLSARQILRLSGEATSSI